jgi:hypothetical protein
MNRQDAEREFGEALASSTDRAKMARFREVFDLVDHALRAGVRRPAVLARLSKLGLELSPATLKSYVERMRREQAAVRETNTAPQSTPRITPDPQTQWPPAHAPAGPPAPVVQSAVPDPPMPAVALPTPSDEGSTPQSPTRSAASVDIAAIRNRTLDLEAMRREWRAHEREQAAAARAAKAAPELDGPSAPAPSGTSAETAPAEYRPFDVRAIRAQNYDLDALRRRWRAMEREQAAAARAAKAAATAQSNGAPVAAPGAQAPPQAAAASGSSPVSVAAPPGADTGNQVDIGSPVGPDRDDSS